MATPSSDMTRWARLSPAIGNASVPAEAAATVGPRPVSRARRSAAAIGDRHTLAVHTKSTRISSACGSISLIVLVQAADADEAILRGHDSLRSERSDWCTAQSNGPSRPAGPPCPPRCASASCARTAMEAVTSSVARSNATARPPPSDLPTTSIPTSTSSTGCTAPFPLGHLEQRAAISTTAERIATDTLGYHGKDLADLAPGIGRVARPLTIGAQVSAGRPSQRRHRRRPRRQRRPGRRSLCGDRRPRRNSWRVGLQDTGA
jgi:hypothetical protein